MKNLFLLLFFTFLMTSQLQADEKIVSTVNNVDLIAVNKVDKDGHNGTEYFAFNHNNYSVKVEIKLKTSTNTLNALKGEPTTLAGDKRVSLGGVFQENAGVEAKWDVEWEVTQIPSTPQ